MISLKSFRIDKSKSNSMDCMREKKIFIDSFINQKIFNRLIIKLSNYIKIDPAILELKIKKIVSGEFNFENNCFNNNSSYFQIIKNFIIFYYFLFLITFRSKKSEPIKTDIILFNVDYFDDVEKFKKILCNYSHSTIITNKKFNFMNIKKSIQDTYLRENIKIDYGDGTLNINFKDKNNSYKINATIKCKHDIEYDSIQGHLVHPDGMIGMIGLTCQQWKLLCRASPLGRYALCAVPSSGTHVFLGKKL